MFVKKSSISKIKQEYMNFNESICPFQEYNNIKKSAHNIAYSVRFFSFVSVYCVYDDNNLILIAPIRLSIGKKCCSILGTEECFKVVDLIYKIQDPNLLADAYECLFSYLHNRYGIRTIRWDCLPNDSLSKSALDIISQKKKVEVHYIPFDNVAIDLSDFDSYETYFSSLSKSVRQNIRTAYNRINRNGFSYECNCIIGKPRNCDRDNIQDGLSLYLKRQTNKYSHSGLGHWLNVRYFHYLSKTMEEQFSFHSSLKINNSVVAMMQGYFDKNKARVIIHWLAIDDEYSFYSPGYLLICETIKKLVFAGPCKSIDLSQGTEKYKFDLGGEIYSSSNIRINI